MFLTRRDLAACAGLALGASIIVRPGTVLAKTESDPITPTLSNVEQKLGARLGAVIVDTGSGSRWRHRAGERFPICSTFKAIAAAALLVRVDEGREDLGRRVRIEAGDVVDYSPVTKDRVGGNGMTLAELCEAAVTRSDNTAGNMILRAIGGPAGFTAFMRSVGDEVTRLDRWETELNEAKPDDPRDTTTPAAMAGDLQTLVLGGKLSEKSRDQLVTWLVSNKTGDAKLRAGLPRDWRIGDKTGGGELGTMNDIAVMWPRGRKPLIAALYMTETKASVDDRNAGFAEIGRAIRAAMGR